MERVLPPALCHDRGASQPQRRAGLLPVEAYRAGRSDTARIECVPVRRHSHPLYQLKTGRYRAYSAGLMKATLMPVCKTRRSREVIRTVGARSCPRTQAGQDFYESAASSASRIRPAHTRQMVSHVSRRVTQPDSRRDVMYVIDEVVAGHRVISNASGDF